MPILLIFIFSMINLKLSWLSRYHEDSWKRIPPKSQSQSLVGTWICCRGKSAISQNTTQRTCPSSGFLGSPEHHLRQSHFSSIRKLGIPWEFLFDWWDRWPSLPPPFVLDWWPPPNSASRRPNLKPPVPSSNAPLGTWAKRVGRSCKASGQVLWQVGQVGIFHRETGHQ